MDDIKTQKVKLLADHTHAGMKYKAGAEITLDVASAKWLVDNKVANNAADAPAPPASPASPASPALSTDSKQEASKAPGAPFVETK